MFRTSVIAAFFASSFSEVDGDFFLKGLIALSAVVLLASNIKSLFFNPANSSVYATKAELAEMKERFEKLECGLERVADAGEERSIKIHNRLNDIVEKIGELRGKVK